MELNNLPDYIESTSWVFVEEQPEYLLATDLITQLQQAFNYVAERPRWNSWYDQITRSSQSVLFNFSEAIGKGRGYFTSAGMIARGEAYETASALSIGPQEICKPLQPIIRQLIEQLNKRLIWAAQQRN